MSIPAVATDRPAAASPAAPWLRVHCRYCREYQKIDVQPPPPAARPTYTRVSFVCRHCRKSQEIRVPEREGGGGVVD